MNRRSFLGSIGKICTVIPFLGSSSATDDSGVSEGKLKYATLKSRTTSGKMFFINTKTGNDENDGLGFDSAFKTYDRVYDEIGRLASSMCKTLDDLVFEVLK